MKKILLITAVVAMAVSVRAVPFFTSEDIRSELFQSKSLSRPSVSFYVEPNFKGRLTRVKAPMDFEGSAALKKIGIPNDSLLSLKVPAGVKVTLYDADGYGGESMAFTEGEHASIGKMAKRVSSLKVEMMAKQ